MYSVILGAKISQVVSVTPTALIQRAGVALEQCTLSIYHTATFLSPGQFTDGYGALVQKWNSILQAIYGGATLAISR